MNNTVQTSSSAQLREDGRSQQDKPRQAAQERHVVPPVDVFENDNAITLLADLPGVTREQLHLRVDGDNLLLEATATATGPDNMQLVYGEAQCPAYRRQFTLSRELDTSRIDAQLRDGVLRLTIPKAEDARPRRIDVRAG